MEEVEEEEKVEEEEEERKRREREVERGSLPPAHCPRGRRIDPEAAAVIRPLIKCQSPTHPLTRPTPFVLTFHPLLTLRLSSSTADVPSTLNSPSTCCAHPGLRRTAPFESPRS